MTATGPSPSYEWDFGDGSPVASGMTASHTYSATGVYQVELTVTDDRVCAVHLNPVGFGDSSECGAGGGVLVVVVGFGCIVRCDGVVGFRWHCCFVCVGFR